MNGVFWKLRKGILQTKWHKKSTQLKKKKSFLVNTLKQLDHHIMHGQLSEPNWQWWQLKYTLDMHICQSTDRATSGETGFVKLKWFS